MSARDATHGDEPDLVLEGRRVSLRQVAPHHHPFLIELMSSPLAGGRARYFGATPSPEEVRARLWDGVLAQFVVEANEAPVPLGLVVLSSPNFADRYCYLSAVARPEAIETGAVMEGAVLLVEYAFSHWDLRKLYFEVLESNLGQFESLLTRHARVEGRLRAHHFVDGRYVDQYLLALYRDDAIEAVASLRDGSGFAPRLEGSGPVSTLDDFGSFVVELRGVVPLDPQLDDAQLDASTPLRGGIFDSLQLVELHYWLEGLAGGEVGEADLSAMTTLGDVWELVRNARETAGPRTSRSS